MYGPLTIVLAFMLYLVIGLVVTLVIYAGTKEKGPKRRANESAQHPRR